MGTPEEVRAEDAPRALGPYAQAVTVGDWIFLSGQIGIEPTTGELIRGGFEEEVEQVFSNLEAVLRAARSGFDRVVRVTVYLTDLREFPRMNRIYEGRLGGSRPARSTVGVAALPGGARVEIDAIAVRG